MNVTAFRPSILALDGMTATLAFVALVMGAQGASQEWGLSGNLLPCLGGGVLGCADFASQALSSFGTNDGATVLRINGQPAPEGAVGIGASCSAAGLITANSWCRLAVGVDLAAHTISCYVNGSPVATGSGSVDGRFSLDSNRNAGPDPRLFNEVDSSGQCTHVLLVSGIRFTEGTMSESEIAALGGPNAAGLVAVPEPSAWVLFGAGCPAACWSRRFRRR